MQKMVQFVRECIAEMKKVVWPSFSDVVSSAKVVFVSTIVIAVFLGLLDFIFTSGMNIIF